MNKKNDVDSTIKTEIVKNESKKTCFVIMPIADMSGYEPRHFDRVYNHIIKPACIKSDFNPIRADEVTNSNFIVLDILRRIVECDIAICDLSGRNPNVMYELGLRQAFNKKTVLIKDEKTVSPFDVQAFRYCEYDSTLRIDNAFTNIESLSNAIKTTYNADKDDVNSIVQLLKIQPAQVGERTVLSQPDTLILEAIKDLSNRLEGKEKRQSIFKMSSFPRAETNIDEKFTDQLKAHNWQGLVGNYYRVIDGESLGAFKGVVPDLNGNEYFQFNNGKKESLLPGNSPIISKLVEDIPF